MSTRSLSRQLEDMLAQDRELEAPRWPGGPPICGRENLPTFATPDDLIAFQQKTNPGGSIKRMWTCPACEGWHYEGKI